MAIIALLVIFILLQICDVYTTYRALRSPANYEKNPVLRWLMAKMGVLPALVLVKVVAVAVVSFLCWIMPPDGTLLMIIVMAAVNVSYAAIVINNIRRI